MVSQATIQSKISYGFGKAASIIGASYAQYRCATYDSPIQSTYQVGALFAAFDVAPSFQFISPSKIDIDVYFGMMDLTNVQTGDYLVGPQGTFFVSYIEPLKPPICVRCPYLMTVTRNASRIASGAQAFREFNGSQDVTLASMIPGSFTLEEKSRTKPLTGLYDDAIQRTTWKGILSPAYAGAESGSIQADDVVIDQNGTKYQVFAAFWHPTGWQVRLELLE
jgi:hypothetical protein